MKGYLWVFIAAAAIAASMEGSAQQSGLQVCNNSNIEVISFSPRVESYGSRNQFRRLVLVGELRNGCSIAVGAEIEIVARDADGTLMDSVRGWPASTNNIAPGGTAPINFTGRMDYVAGMDSFDLRVVTVHQWRQR